MMKKRALSLLLALVLALGLLPGRVRAAEPTVISTVEELVAIDMKGSYRLERDLALPNNTVLGSKDLPFTGTFDGDGHTVSGIYHSSSSDDYVGLFAAIGSDGVVKNLKVQVATGSYGYVHGNEYVGVLTGYNEGTIENCGVESSGDRSNSYAVSGGQHVGGIAGYSSGTIAGCYNKEEIHGAGSYAGGIAGEAVGALENCYSLGAVSTESNYCGGIVGKTTSVLRNCYAAGELGFSGSYRVTLAGILSGNSGGVYENCYYASDAHGSAKGLGKAKTDPQVIARASADMREAAFAELLGPAFQAAPGTYPALAWETGSVEPPAEVPATSISLTVPASNPQDKALTFNLDAGGATYQLQYTVKPANATEEPTWESLNEAVATVDESGLLTLVGVGETTITARIRGSSTANAYDTCTVTVTSDRWLKEQNEAAVENVRDTLAAPSAEFGPVVREDIASASLVTSPVADNRVPVRVSYVSSHPNILRIGANSVASITRPAEGGNVAVTLTATLTAGEGDLAATASRDFVVTVWSRENAEKDEDLYVEGAAAALGTKLAPVYGRDTNVLTMARALLAADYGEASVSLKAVGAAEDAAIAESGDITYFYHDPEDTGNLVWSASIPVTFTLRRGAASRDREVRVLVGWDRARVNAYLERSIFPALSVPASASGDLELPRYVGGKGGKTWVELSWTSSNDRVLEISGQNQSSGADARYSPYVGVVKRGDEDQAVTLTVTAVFQRTNGSSGGAEQPIALEKTFAVQVAKLDPAAAEAIRQGLLARLDAGFASAGLIDAVTGERLAESGGVYTAVNDLLLPTTADFGVDGRDFPVVLTTSDPGVVVAPEVKNAARVTVYRPLPGSPEAGAEVTVTLQDRDTSVAASRTLRLRVPALTQGEIDNELRLMEWVKASYFDGLNNGANVKREFTYEGETDEGVYLVYNDLTPFQEVYADGDDLVWVRDSRDRVRRGIVPVPMDGWEELEAWRLFRSSNPAYVAHESLRLHRAATNKQITVTSWLSSETLGKYAERYPGNADLQRLSKQPVSAQVMVMGKVDFRSRPVSELLTASFTLQSRDGVWIGRTTLDGLPEATTVYDVFRQVLGRQGYTYQSHGSYVTAVTHPGGATLAELDGGANSGWLYKVNGRIPDVAMGGYGLCSGDEVVVFFTKDYTEEQDYAGGDWNRPQPEKPPEKQPEKAPETAGSAAGEPEVRPGPAAVDGTKTYTVKLPAAGEGGASAGGVKVRIPGVGEGQVMVLVHADGMETVVRKSLVEDGTAYLLLEADATVKVVDTDATFADVAPEAWYAGAVAFATGRRLFGGTSAETFGPDGSMTRGMLAQVLYRLEDEPEAQGAPFSDLAPDAWCAEAVGWAARAGLVTGYADGSFGAERALSRQQLATLLYRYAGFAGVDTAARADLSGYRDAAQAADYAEDALAWAVGSGLLRGRAGNALAPDAAVTRAETAVLLQRLLGLLVK